MSDQKKRDLIAASSNTRPEVDPSRRSLTRLGLGAPVLMTLASQPVFGANCLSNALSGNLSDPDRGQCLLGLSIPTVQRMSAEAATAPAPGGFTSSDLATDSGVLLRDTALRALTTIFSPVDDFDKTTAYLVWNGDSLQQAVIAAWVNTRVTPGYVLTEAQLLGLANGDIQIPYGLPLEAYLVSTLQP